METFFFSVIYSSFPAVKEVEKSEKRMFIFPFGKWIKIRLKIRVDLVPDDLHSIAQRL